jgi:glyoxylase-like metal-dependent hydrolase (beta-lactamase superfamily II)
MEIIDKLEVFSRLDELRTAVYGEPVLILPDTFLLKFPKHEHRFGNAYMIRHRNQKDIVLIDAVREEHKSAIESYKESGYEIKAILLTHRDLSGQSYKPIHEIAEDLNTNYFIHSLDSGSDDKALDITGYNDVFKEFDLSVFHTPGHTPGSVTIFCGINKALFTGDSAVGSPYENDDYYFDRPIIKSEQDDLALRESWMSMSVEFEHVLPLHGKPQFDLNEQQRKDILRNLIKTESTKSL